MNNLLRNIFWVALLALPFFVSAQEVESLSDKDQRKFDTYFFEAEKFKQIERYENALELYLACAKIDEDNATVQFEIARAYLRLNKPTEALMHFENANALAPDNKWISVELAAFYKAIDETEKATTLYEKLTADFPSDVAFQFELAQLYFSQKELKKCIATLDQLEVLLGVNEELSEQKKEIYLLQDDVKGAEKELVKLVKAYPTNVEYKGILAQFYMANDEIKKAEKIYAEMLVSSPNDPRAHLDLANIYKQKGKFDLSFQHLEMALGNPDLEVDQKIQVLYSFFQLSDKDTLMRKMSYSLIETSIEASPNDGKLYAMRGDFLMRDNRLKEARNSYRKATRLGENQLQLWSQVLLIDAQTNQNDSLAIDGETFIELYPNQPLGYLMAGSGRLQLDQSQKAVNHFEAGLDFVLDNPELEEQFFISLADGHNRLKNYGKSDAYFEKALAINPNDAGVLNNYAFYLSERGVRLNEALEMAQKSNRLSPKNGVFLDTWAWVLFKLGKYNLALEKIEECGQYGGANSGEVLEHWGDILFKLNRKEEAFSKWEEAASKPDATESVYQKLKTGQLYE